MVEEGRGRMNGVNGTDNVVLLRSNENEKITTSVVLSCIVAGSCGLIFGYDVGISGGVSTMQPFLQQFFPSVLKKMASSEQNTYCVYNSQVLTAFTSSLYLAGLASSLVASPVTKAMGRRATMVLGGFTFLIGALINGVSMNLSMLILGRILLGFGLGFTTQAAPVYLSEMAPSKWRGAFNIGFELFLGIGVVISGTVNFLTSQIGDQGWRFSLGLAAVPAAVMVLGALLVSDTPSSLVGRGKVAEARKSLEKVRGSNANVEAELDELISASEAAKTIHRAPNVTIFERKHRPYLVMSIMIPFFQQISGIGVVAFYAPVLFQSIGFGSNPALIGAIILGVTNLSSIIASMIMVDRFGRRALFIEGGIQMIICQVALAGVIGVELGTTGDKPLSRNGAIAILVLMCFFAAGFGWSWGPLTWLIPSEILPMNIRPVGQSISVAVNFATTFVMSQAFLAMLCKMKYGVFLFYGGWITVMTVFIAFFLPETKGIPLESMHNVWEKHWYWRRFTQEA